MMMYYYVKSDLNLYTLAESGKVYVTYNGETGTWEVRVKEHNYWDYDFDDLLFDNGILLARHRYTVVNKTFK